MGFWGGVKDFIGGEQGRVETTWAGGEGQQQQYQDYLKNQPGVINQAMQSQGQAQQSALSALNDPNQFLRGLKRFSPQATDVGMLTAAGLPTAQTQFSIGGAPGFQDPTKPFDPSQIQQAQGQTFTAQRPGELTQAMAGLQGFTPDQSVTQAQQNLAGVMGGLGAFTQGAGSGQSAATLAQSAALGKMQETSMANALGQLREQGFTGAATAGGMGNLASMAAAQSAGQFAQQRAGLLESERQAALQASGMQGQFAQGMGQLGLGAGQQRQGALTSMGGLASDEAGRMLTAQMETGRQGLQATGMNQDAALRSAQLAQQGDIAGAELALKGTGMNMEQAMALNQLNTQRSIANQGAQLTASGQYLDAQRTGADLIAQQQRAQASILANSPQMQALQYQQQFGSQLAPTVSSVAGRGGMLAPIAQAGGAIAQGVAAFL